MLEGFRMIQELRVPFGDIDMLRHVNNAVYVVWAEQIRSEYFASVLLEDITGRHGMILAKLEIVYERQIAYREAVAIACRIERVGGKSFDFDYAFWSRTQGMRCARARSTMVAYDYAAGATIAVPRAWHARIAAFEADPAAIAGLKTSGENED